MVAGAVGFDKAAVGGRTAALFLELALELLQRRAWRAVHLLPGWWLAVGGASVLGAGPGSRPPTGALVGRARLVAGAAW